MNVVIGAEAAQFPEEEYMDVICVAVYGEKKIFVLGRLKQPRLK